MFVVGIITSIRIGYIVELRVKDLRGRTHINILEQKTIKGKRFLIYLMLKQEIDKFIKSMADDEYLFQSRKGENRPISRFLA